MELAKKPTAEPSIDEPSKSAEIRDLSASNNLAADSNAEGEQMKPNQGSMPVAAAG